MGNTTYRRNRQQLILLKTKQQRWLPYQAEEVPQPIRQPENVSPSNTMDHSPEYPDTPSSRDNNSASNTMPEDNTMMPRRSEQTTRKPTWMADYIPS